MEFENAASLVPAAFLFGPDTE